MVWLVNEALMTKLRSEMQSRDLVVERLGQHVDIVLVLLLAARAPELDLRDGLVGKRGAHDEAQIGDAVARPFRRAPWAARRHRSCTSSGRSCSRARSARWSGW